MSEGAKRPSRMVKAPGVAKTQPGFYEFASTRAFLVNLLSAESVHGEKYVVEGSLSRQTQESRRARVRTVWIIDRGDAAPRLVTAYPSKE